ncbi:MAG: glycosyltransferase, partial [Candidatus Eremiobacteraeota bacterium]|nr:glycosyltransferase [Candidatus Eremiobacteraeota bacterium]
MKALRKVVFILASRGGRVLVRRVLNKLIASLRAGSHRRRRSREWKKATRLLTIADGLMLPSADVPEVSVIVPVFGGDRFTYSCLRAVAKHVDLAAEIIIVDDGSQDQTQRFLRSLNGVRCIRNDQSIGYFLSCNRGAAAARGTFVCFLNNDTIVQQHWLSELVKRAKTDADIGAVGSKLLYPNRAIASAGGIIWRDGSGCSFGRGRAEDDPACAYPRDVDYCSSASLLVDRRQFLELGGFEGRYAGAYHEDAAFSVVLRGRGLRAVFEPRSVVMHFGSPAAAIGRETVIDQSQRDNCERFADKFSAELEAHYSSESRNAARAARRLSGHPRILVIDRFVPFADRDAGSLRLLNLLILLRGLHCDLTFYPDEGIAHEPHAQRLRDHGIEVLGKTQNSSAHRQLRERRGMFDIAWLCRPDITAHFAPSLRQQDCRIWYDTVDLHFVRLQRQEQVTARATGWRRTQKMELSLARSADATIVTSPTEADLLVSENVRHVHVIPPVYTRSQTIVPWAERSGLLFIGNYIHEPNVDAALHLAIEIFPALSRAIPGLQLTLAGNEPPLVLLRLQSAAIIVPGHLDTLAPCLERARVF